MFHNQPTKHSQCIAINLDLFERSVAISAINSIKHNATGRYEVKDIHSFLQKKLDRNNRDRNDPKDDQESRKIELSDAINKVQLQNSSIKDNILFYFVGGFTKDNDRLLPNGQPTKYFGNLATKEMMDIYDLIIQKTKKLISKILLLNFVYAEHSPF